MDTWHKTVIAEGRAIAKDEIVCIPMRVWGQPASCVGIEMAIRRKVSGCMAISIHAGEAPWIIGCNAIVLR